MNKYFELYPKNQMNFIRNKVINKTGMFYEAFTTRTGGESEGVYESLNTGFNTLDSHKRVVKNIDKIKRALHIDKIYAPVQVHGDNVCVITPENRTYVTDTECDALITDEKGYAIAVRAADCVTSVIACPDKKVIAAVHTGWRGVANKLILKTAMIMINEFRCSPEHMLVSMSPAIAPKSFAVGPDVYEILRKDPLFARIFKEKKIGITMNMWQGNKNLLLSCGVKEENIFINEMDTFTHSKMFYSYRRDGKETGRMMYLIGIK